MLAQADPSFSQGCKNHNYAKLLESELRNCSYLLTQQHPQVMDEITGDASRVRTHQTEFFFEEASNGAQVFFAQPNFRRSSRAIIYNSEMAYIYLDESGDLGSDLSKDGTSKSFIITFLLLEKPRPVMKLVQKTIQSIGRRQRYPSGALHASKEASATRRRLLSGLSRQQLSIFTLTIDKSRMQLPTRITKHDIYNSAVATLLQRIIVRNLIPGNQPIEFVASKRETSKLLNMAFEKHLIQHVIGQHQTDLRIQIKPMHSDKCLQAVDMISWAIFRKTEQGDNQYYSLIAGKIMHESLLTSL